MAERICFDSLTPEAAALASESLFSQNEKSGSGTSKIILLCSPENSGKKNGDSLLFQRGPGKDVFALAPSSESDLNISLEALKREENLDLSRSVFIGKSLDALKTAAKTGGRCVYYLDGENSRNPLNEDFLPQITAPSQKYALSFASALLRHPPSKGGIGS